MKEKWNPLTGRFDLVNEANSGFVTKEVDELPETGEEGVMYVVEYNDYSETYVWTDNHYVQVGDTAHVDQKQADWTQEDQAQVDYIKNKPVLATVATSGDYNDLNNQPSIPEPQIQSNWNEADNTSKAYILNKPTLSAVATSGNYEDLSNTPTIPAAQIQSDWNQSNASAVDFIKNKPNLSGLEIPFKPFPSAFETTGTTQEFLDSIVGQNLPVGMAYLGQVSLSDMPSGIGVQAEVEVYVYPQNVIYCVMRSAEVSPYIWEVNSYENRGWEPVDSQANWTQNNSNARDYIKNKPSLSTVATSGSYNDLSDKPTIPTVNDGTLTIQKNGANVDSFTANSASNKVINITVPVNTSDLNNNSGFITNTVNNLQNYYLNTQTYTKSEVDNLIGQITTLQFQVVQSLPSTGSSNIIYLLDTGTGYEQYVYTNNTWTLIGTTSIDLSNYVQKTDTLLTINGTGYTQGDSVSVFDGDYNNLTNKPTIPPTQVQSDWNESNTSSKAYIWNKPSLATVATTGSYNDLSNKPTIPAAQIQSDWNQTNTTAKDYIKNKPTIPAAVVVDSTLSTTSTNPVQNKVLTTALNAKADASSIPTVYNGTLTIQKNGSTINTFTANSSSNKTVNITVPTTTSDLTNNSGFVTSSNLATVATSGSYNDLSNKPSIPTVNNGTLYVYQGGSYKGSFSANQSGSTTINLDSGGSSGQLGGWANGFAGTVFEYDYGTWSYYPGGQNTGRANANISFFGFGTEVQFEGHFHISNNSYSSIIKSYTSSGTLVDGYSNSSVDYSSEVEIASIDFPSNHNYYIYRTFRTSGNRSYIRVYNRSPYTLSFRLTVGGTYLNLQ